MSWKPERISTKVVIPLVLAVFISLSFVFILLTRHTTETVIRLNTAALKLETKRLYHFCEKAVEELIIDQKFGSSEHMAAKKEVVLSEIENHLLSEGIEGVTVDQQGIILSTIHIDEKPYFEGASGTLELSGKEGLFYGYYLYFPVWEWHLLTLLHEDDYWAGHERIKVILVITGIVYLILGSLVLVILLRGVQKPLQKMATQLIENGRIDYLSGTKELDLLASTINRQLEEIVKESEAKIERKKIEHELAIARSIQESFLPAHHPTIGGIDIAAKAVPALQVGGDFYDFIPLNGDRQGFVIADVSGKGMPAALLMALSCALIRVISSEDISVQEVLEKTNRRIQEYATEGYFVTVFYAILDISDRDLHYIRAGHNPPLLYKSESDEIIFLEGKGVGLGVLDEINVETRHIQLTPGDILVLFTDGVTEAINQDNEEFGTARLCSLVREYRNKSAKEIIEKIERDMTTFVSGEPQFDDITLMVIKV